FSIKSKKRKEIFLFKSIFLIFSPSCEVFCCIYRPDMIKYLSERNAPDFSRRSGAEEGTVLSQQ
ncbi:MAG: hypothetical protein J5592_08110, partial [Clostridia bacterium]|nr:hypothetical protein [Clostridia bacterium]